MWPKRTAGSRLRIVVLLPPATIDEVIRDALTRIAALSRDAFDIAIATIGRAAPDVMALARTVVPAVAELPTLLDTSVGNALAARDFDVLVDLVGAVAAPLLAQRPARVIHASASIAEPNASPLADHMFDDAGVLTSMLVAQHAGLDASRDSAIVNEALLGTQPGDLRRLINANANVFNAPLLATDAYGNFIKGPNGFPQVVMSDGAGGTFLVEGDPLNPIDLTNAVGTGHQFLIDIAHSADPSAAPGLVRDDDGVIGNAPPPGTYDGELLDAHYMAGDGRVCVSE